MTHGGQGACSPPGGGSGPGGVRIGRKVYRNSAALFWPGFLDGLSNRPGRVSFFELSAACCGPISRDILFPDRALRRDLERALKEGSAGRLADAVAELAMLGPPGPVRLKLVGEDSSETVETMPESVNAETFVFLVAWLLEWAGVPETRWNGPVPDHVVEIRDLYGSGVRSLRFSLFRRHLSEGLEEATLRGRAEPDTQS